MVGRSSAKVYLVEEVPMAGAFVRLVIACWRVPSSRMVAQLKSALVICSIVFPLVSGRHDDGRGAT